MYAVLEKLKESKPLVHHITNWVTIYDCANVTRVLGALPVMAHAKEEVEEMASGSQALVLNIGTLTPDLVDSMISAGKKANEKGAPIIMDAVGVGSTSLRTDKAKEILEKVHVDIVKGNLGEMGTLAGVKASVRGVESNGAAADAKDVASAVARKYKTVAVVTGKDSVASDGKMAYVVSNGHIMMTSVVGTGCMAASVIAAFAAVENDHVKAAAYALVCFGIAGQLAAAKSKGPGSFMDNFYDEIYSLDEKKIAKLKKIKKVKV
ncbi:MAG: hydroxyethylthiazole kinase [Candidatus Aenigmarchaeota archaeon]|nr:hydroxyethylthiazole kinase [Candidatus Aenigmarchaeota archaeon]